MQEDVIKAMQRSIMSLLNMVNEMYRKNIELSRIAKTSSLLIMSGVSTNTIPQKVIDLCVLNQKEDGGWVGVADTIWCVKLLSNYENYNNQVEKAKQWLKQQKVEIDGWGRSKRDMGRIPVTGILHYLLPDMVTEEEIEWLENLWLKENNSITYKAAYTLMAFRQKSYIPKDKGLIINTIRWLQEQQNEDGGFGPWRNHPVGSNILCTAIAVIGLMQYKQFVEAGVFKKSIEYITRTQLPNGLWRYHQIEDGSSWGVFALSMLQRNGA